MNRRLDGGSNNTGGPWRARPTETSACRRRSREACHERRSLHVVPGELMPPRDPGRRHLLSVADLDRDDVERLLATAHSFALSQERDTKKLPTLRGRLVVNMFFESSTRTSSSFELAAKRLSADTLSMKASGSSVDKGESLKDTALTLSAYDPDVIVIRHPQIGAPQLVASVTDAHVVNAGDGKHQHPTQALLDLYSIQDSLGRLEGVHVAIVGDVLHSRVARSLIQALHLVGASVVLVGPPPLLPRELGEVSYDIDAIRDADVVYVLRMQRERMEQGANYVPSLREYSARWCVTPERLRAGQKVMHPGPMNRGVEIDPRVADSAVGARRRPGARRARRPDGRALRPAHDGPGRGRDRRGGRMSSVLVGGSGADDLVVRGARVLDPTEGVDPILDVRIDGGTISAIGAGLDVNGHRVDRRRRASFSRRPSSTRTSTCARPAARTRRRSPRGTAAAAAGGYCAILAMPNTDPVVDTPDVLRGLRARAEDEAEIPVGFTAAITMGQEGTQLTEMGELADAGAAAFTDDGRPVATAGLMRRALEYNAITGRRLALALRGAEPHPRRPHAHGCRLGRARPRRLALARREPRRLARALARRATPGSRSTSCTSRRASRSSCSGARATRASRRAARSRRITSASPTRPSGALDPNLKMNPPLRTDVDRAALIEALLDGTIEAIATDHAPHSREEKDVPFEAAPFGVTGLETAFASLYTSLVEPGLVPLEIAARADVGRARRGSSGSTGRGSRSARPRTSSCSARTATWKVREDRFRSRSANSWLLGRRLQGKVLLTVAAGRVAYEA